MSAPRGNLVAVSLGRLLVAVSSFVVNVAVARLLPREDFGVYRWVWSVAAVASFAADLGLWQLVTRQVANEPARANRYVAVGLQATALLALPATLAVAGWIALTDGRGWVVGSGVLAVATVIAIAAAHHVQAGFYGLRRMFLEVPSLAASRAVFVVASLAVVAWGGGVVSLYVARLASALVLLGWVVVTFRRAVAPLELGVDVPELRAFVGQGRLFGASVLASTVIAQADVLLLQVLATETEVARYAAPASLLLQLGMVPTILSSGLFPRLARLGRDDPEVRTELAFQTRLLLLVALPLALGGAVVAQPLIVLLFGDRYADATVPTVLLLLTIPLRFAANGYGVALTALDQQRVRARVTAIAAGFNLVANLAAIPLLGAEGAALTTLLTDLVLVIGTRAALGDVLGRERAILVRTLLPAIAMAVLVAVLPEWHVLARVAVGGVVFLVLSWLTGGLKRSDLAHLHGV